MKKNINQIVPNKLERDKDFYSNGSDFKSQPEIYYFITLSLVCKRTYTVVVLILVFICILI